MATPVKGRTPRSTLQVARVRSASSHVEAPCGGGRTDCESLQNLTVAAHCERASSPVRPSGRCGIVPARWSWSTMRVSRFQNRLNNHRTRANLVSTLAAFISLPMRPRPSKPGLRRDEDVASWELLEQCRRLAEVGGQHVGRVPRHPFRQVDLLVDPGVEPDEDAALSVADVLDRVPVPLRGETDVALLERLRAIAPARTEQRDADLPLEDVLPLIGVGVPVQLPQRPARVRGPRR